MTDLVAEAIARLQKEKLDTETWLANEESWTSQDDIDHARYYLRIVDCHLAEFEEHKGAHSEVGYVCQKCTKSFSQDGMTIRQYPCDFATTKVKRLLGRE